MPDLSTFPAVLLVVVLGAVAGLCAAELAIWALKRRTLGLEYAVADLENQVLREIKKRAGEESRKSKKTEDDLLSRIAEQPKPDNVPWWQKYVTNPELRQ